MGSAPAQEQLRARARAARERAYAPYSGFRVGAALQAVGGAVYVGANVENASYALSMCAERVALGSAVADGVTQFARIVVATEASPPSAPCGACRQALSEFGVEMAVEAVNDREVRTWRLSDLVPAPFGKGDVSR